MLTLQEGEEEGERISSEIALQTDI